MRIRVPRTEGARGRLAQDEPGELIWGSDQVGPCRSWQGRQILFLGKPLGSLESFEQGSDIIEFAFSEDHFGSWVGLYEREGGLEAETVRVPLRDPGEKGRRLMTGMDPRCLRCAGIRGIF